MEITINGNTYNASIFGNTISLETNMTLAQIEEAFTPGEDVNVIISENGEEVSRYYNRGILSIKVTKSSPREVAIEVDLTKIKDSAETEIRESIDTSDDAIAELAEMISELMERVEALEEKEESDDG